MAEESNIWQQVLNQLQLQMPRATFDTWLRNTSLIGIDEAASPPAYMIDVDSNYAADWLENRLTDVIKRTLQAVVGHPVAIRFVPREKKVYPPIDDEVEEDEPEDANIEIVGVYHNKGLAIIQPGKVEVHTQYFRKKWRPLLGPLLSELVRELRQRCHFKTRRNSFKTTYESLARALGVSERTIQRALQRNEDGLFKNEYLNYFIKEIQVIQRRDEAGQIRNVGTRFVIYLDEPLTQADQALLQDEPPLSPEDQAAPPGEES